MQARSGEVKWEGSEFTRRGQAPFANGFQWEVVISQRFLLAKSPPVAYFGVPETWNPGLFS